MTPRAPALLLAIATLLGSPGGSLAFSDQPYVGGLELVGFPYCPAGSVEPRGQTLKADDYALLAVVLGTRFGGDKAAGTFMLPDLQGQAPAGMHYCLVTQGAYPQQQ